MKKRIWIAVPRPALPGEFLVGQQDMAFQNLVQRITVLLPPGFGQSHPSKDQSVAALSVFVAIDEPAPGTAGNRAVIPRVSGSDPWEVARPRWEVGTMMALADG